MASIDATLQEMGLTLPTPPAALFNYVPYVIAGNLVFVAGQVPVGGPREYKGKVGMDLSIEEGAEAARQCALNILAQVKAAVNGDWGRVKRCVKLGGFVNCPGDFTDMSVVLNGASDLMVAVMGDDGRHARFAVGAPSLPAGFAVEVDAVFEILPA